MTPSATHSFAEERRAAIMAMLDRSASVQVAELARTFGVSAVTIRTDLDALEADGKLRRTHDAHRVHPRPPRERQRRCQAGHRARRDRAR